MALGPMLRKWMSPHLERRLSGIYRSVFVDLRQVAATLAPALPNGARILDIGGGDGELLNHLFALRPDLHVTMVDIAPSVGKFVEARHGARVELRSGTSVEQHLSMSPPLYDSVLISDVMHHLPGGYRGDFLRAVSASLKPGGSVFVKDVEPGHPVAWLSLICDHYVSGDHGVVLVSAAELGDLAARVLPPHQISEIGLLAKDRPNYLVRLEFGPA